MYKMLSLYLIITTLSVILCNGNSKAGSEILVLDKNNFDVAVKDNEYIFVKFYASWCKYSRQIAPQFKKAAKKVLELEVPVIFAEIEASDEKELCQKFNVFGYPTLILFRRGAPIVYHDDRKAAEIVLWIRSQVRSAVKQLYKFEDLLDLINTDNITVVGFYDNVSSPEATNFKTIAEHFAKPPFAITSNQEVMKKYNATSGRIILFDKTITENAMFVDELTLPNMKSFVEIETAPLIHELTNSNGESIFGGSIKNHLLMFVSKRTSDVENVINHAKPVAKNYSKKIMFLTVNIEDEQLAQILTYFNIKPSETPAIGLIANEGIRVKYKMEGLITTDNLRNFLHDFEEKKLSKVFLSESLPKDWNKTPVYTLVTTNFLNVTRDPEKVVVVYFYTMDCKSCPVWDIIVMKLGKIYISHKDVVIAKINVGLNELEKAPFKEIPSIVLYKKGLNKYVLYKGNPKLEDIVQFIESNGKKKVNTEL